MSFYLAVVVLMLELFAERLKSELPALPLGYKYAYSIGVEDNEPIVIVSVGHEDPDTLSLTEIFASTLDINVAFYVTNPPEDEEECFTYNFKEITTESINTTALKRVVKEDLDRLVDGISMFLDLLGGMSTDFERIEGLFD